MQRTKEIEILLVEDNDVDVELLRMALSKSTLSLNLNVCSDGEKAMQYLQRQAPYDTAKKPDLVLLDMNLPRKNGREVLQEMKNDDALQKIPVVVLTTAASDRDIRTLLEFPHTRLLTKPFRFDGYKDVIGSIESFWRSVEG